MMATLRPRMILLMTHKIHCFFPSTDLDASGADDEVPAGLPALDLVDPATGDVLKTLFVPAAQKPRKMLIEEVSSGSSEEEDIPEEISQPRSKTKWHSVEEAAPAAAPASKKPLIEMIGGDDMDGLD